MVVRRSAGATVVGVVFGIGSGSTGVESTGVELLSGTLVEGSAGAIVVVVAANRGAVDCRLTGTETRTGP